MSLEKETKADRLHIAVFGRTNSGKSTLVNAIAGKELALVSSKPSPTKNPVYKPVEIDPLGPVVFIDTAGFEGEEARDEGQSPSSILDEVDIALMLFDQIKMEEEKRCYLALQEKNIPVIPIISKGDVCSRKALADLVQIQIGIEPMVVNVHDDRDKEKIKEVISDQLSQE